MLLTATIPQSKLKSPEIYECEVQLSTCSLEPPPTINKELANNKLHFRKCQSPQGGWHKMSMNMSSMMHGIHVVA